MCWPHVLVQSALEAKRAHLQTQLEDAKQLREHNERRAEGLRELLQRALTEQEAREFDAFVNVKVPEPVSKAFARPSTHPHNQYD